MVTFSNDVIGHKFKELPQLSVKTITPVNENEVKKIAEFHYIQVKGIIKHELQDTQDIVIENSDEILYLKSQHQ